MITKTYHIITIDISQIIYSTLNPDSYFDILLCTKLDQNDLKLTKQIEQTKAERMGQYRPNGPMWTKLERIDQLGLN